MNAEETPAVVAAAPGAGAEAWPAAELDGLTFDMVSSTASVVDSSAPTRFRYHQAGKLVWGDYAGDTVEQGRFVGELVGAQLRISFAHTRRAGGPVVTGAASSVVERRSGRLHLVEAFDVDGVAHESVCVQV